MKKISSLIFICLTSFIFETKAQTTAHSAQEIKEDLEYLFKNLEESHYNLFDHTSKKKFTKAFKQAKHSLKDSMNTIDAYRVIQPLIALDKNGHCQATFPVEQYMQYFSSEGTLFPLKLCVRNQKVYVTHQFSKQEKIEVGDQILSINGRPIKDILNEIYTYISGETEYFKDTYLELITFPRIYWLVFGECSNFVVNYKDKDSRIKDVLISSIAVNDFEEKNAGFPEPIENNRFFKFIDEIAYFKTGPFSKINPTDEHDASNPEKFHQLVDSIFAELKSKKTTHLILDLRNNSGGHNSFSDYLISYFADKKLRFTNEFMVRTSKITKSYWQDVTDPSAEALKKEILNRPDGDRFENELPWVYPREDSMRFSGKLIVLVNRYDYSQAVNAAAIIQDYGFGILVGEETADCASFYASSHTFELPNTGLKIQYPKAYFTRPNGDKTPRGVIPDHLIENNIHTSDDEILEFALELIRADLN